MGSLGVPELLIIAGVIILLFGARKLPEMARSLGKSAKAFKEETKGMRDSASPDSDDTAKPATKTETAALPEAKPQAQNNGAAPVEQQNKNAS